MKRRVEKMPIALRTVYAIRAAAEAGVTWESTSEYSAPMFIRIKASWEIRIPVSYKRLNAKICHQTSNEKFDWCLDKNGGGKARIFYWAFQKLLSRESRRKNRRNTQLSKLVERLVNSIDKFENHLSCPRILNSYKIGKKGLHGAGNVTAWWHYHWEWRMARVFDTCQRSAREAETVVYTSDCKCMQWIINSRLKARKFLVQWEYLSEFGWSWSHFEFRNCRNETRHESNTGAL